MKSVAVFTLGCRVNQNDEEGIIFSFIQRGYSVFTSEKRYEADVVVVNTCSVTKIAEQKARQLIRKIHRHNNDARIVVTGCYGQRAKDELIDIDGVILVTGNVEKSVLASLVDETVCDKQVIVADISHAKEFSNIEVTAKENNRARAYLKIQDGCEQFCTYCIIPYVRGPVRSRNYDDIIKEAKLISFEGFKELVLIGIHTGFYGKDIDDNISLIDVLKGILSETDIPRIRLSSIEPTEITDELLMLMSENDRLCKYLHIPLQSGDDDILSVMGRHYTGQYYIDLANKIYELMPQCLISADVMTGFPGETEENFNNSVKVIMESKLAFIHPFPYSIRPGTKAAEFPNQIPKTIKEARQKILLDLGRKQKKICYNRYVGQEIVVLIEDIDSNHMWHGHSDNFLEIYFTSDSSDIRGQLVTVVVQSFADGRLVGVMTRR